MSDQRLTLDELAVETDTEPGYIERLVAIGALRPAGDRFTRHDIQRVQLVRAFDESGFGLDRIEKGIRAGIISFEFVDHLFQPPAPRSSRTYAEFEASLGERARLLPGLIGILGFVQPAATRHLRTTDEEMLRRFLEAWGDEPEIALRAARLIADAISKVTTGWTRLYWEHYLNRLLDRGVSPTDARSATAQVSAEIAGLGVDMVVWLEQQYLVSAVETMNIEFIEGAMAAQQLAPPREEREPAVMFADVAGYTALTEQVGDQGAAAVAEALRSAVEPVAREHAGRIIKQLGDGVMVVYESYELACESAARLLGTWSGEQPGLHVGIGVGPLIERDGDYFGATVNLASRLSQAADAGQILVGRTRGPAPTGASLEPIGSITLKGMANPVEVSEVRRREGS